MQDGRAVLFAIAELLVKKALAMFVYIMYIWYT